MATRRVLVTGALGFLGRVLVERLGSKPGIEVVGCGRRKATDGPRCEYHCGDVAQMDFLTSIAGPFDAVVHLAAHRGDDNVGQYLRTNLAGTATILEAALRWHVGRFLFASTAAVYGVNDRDTVVDEERGLRPAGPYGVSKALGEEVVRFAGLSSITLRCTYLYGSEDRTSAVSQVVCAAASGTNVVVPNENRDLLGVTDAAEAMVLALDYAGAHRVFDVGSGTLTAMSAIADRLRAHGATGFSYTLGPQRGNAILESRLARQELGWRPKTHIMDDLVHLVTASREHPHA